MARNTISEEPMTKLKADKSPPSLLITRSRINSNNQNRTNERFLETITARKPKDTIEERLKRQKER